MSLVQRKINSKIGPLYLTASEAGLCEVFWGQKNILNEKNKNAAAEKILDKAEKQLEEYLNGARKNFDLPLDAQGTDFQKKVWKRLSQIPYGITRSYKDIALELADVNASRAVGTANGKNPLCIVVPCHRVISSDGSLGGYSGGLELKTKLLTLEKQGKLE